MICRGDGPDLAEPAVEISDPEGASHVLLLIGVNAGAVVVLGLEVARQRIRD